MIHEILHPVGTPSPEGDFNVAAATQELDAALSAADPDTRPEIISKLEDTLMNHGITIIDSHDAIRKIADFNPDARPDEIGKVSGFTREKILSRIAMKSTQIPRRPRRKL
jgi:hypothetical protein